MHRILNSLLQMQSLFRLEIGLRGHKTYWNEFLWTRSNGWLGVFMSDYTCNNTHPACSPGLAAHCLLNYKLCVDWVTGSGWECSTNNYYHLLCSYSVSSVGSTHTGPQRCVTLMIPYWSSLLKWHHHHYHSISRPLIGQAGDNPALSLADSKLWSYWHCEPGRSVTDARLRSLTVYILLSQHLCLTSNSGGRTLYLYFI